MKASLGKIHWFYSRVLPRNWSGAGSCWRMKPVRKGSVSPVPNVLGRKGCFWRTSPGSLNKVQWPG